MQMTGLGGKLAATTLAIACLGGATVAQGAVSTTKLTISNDDDTFSGSLSSKKPKCEQDRKVTVFRNAGGTLKKIGSDTSNDDGEWSVDSERTGFFLAKVNATSKCSAATSKTIRVRSSDD